MAMGLLKGEQMRVKLSGGILVSLTAVLAGCGSVQSSTPAASTPSDVAEIRATVTRSYGQWAGSLEARQAAELVVAYELNGARAECLNKKGFSTQWERSISPAYPVDPLAASIWLAAPHSRFYSERHRASAWSDQMEPQLHRALPAQDHAASLDCDKVTTTASDEEIDALRQPAPLGSLQDAWTLTLQDVVAPIGSRQDYIDCMIQADLPGKPAGSRDFDALDAAYERARPAPRAVPLGDEAVSAEWGQFMALERRLSDADWACREDSYDAGMALLPAAIAQFEKDHAVEIAEMADHWSQVQSKGSRTRLVAH